MYSAARTNHTNNLPAYAPQPLTHLTHPGEMKPTVPSEADSTAITNPEQLSPRVVSPEMTHPMSFNEVVHGQGQVHSLHSR
jgi:hypothetical protein